MIESPAGEPNWYSHLSAKSNWGELGIKLANANSCVRQGKLRTI